MQPLWSPEYHHPWLTLMVAPKARIAVQNDGQERREIVSIHYGVDIHETIAKGSAILAPAGRDGNLYRDRNGRTPVWFEGGVYDREPRSHLRNLRIAASHMADNYPTLACTEASANLLHPVAVFDMDRRMIVKVLDPDAFLALTGEDPRWHGDPETLPEETDWEALKRMGILPDCPPSMLREEGPGITTNGFLVLRDGDKVRAIHAGDPRILPEIEKLDLASWELQSIFGRNRDILQARYRQTRDTDRNL